MDNIKLYSYMGTKYMTYEQRRDLTALFDKCKENFINTNEQDTIDLAHCKFLNDTYYLVREYADYIKFIDTYNPIIDSILNHNSRVKRTRDAIAQGIIRIEQIPIVTDIKTIKSFLKTLDKSVIYSLPNNVTTSDLILQDISIYIAMCVAYLRPAISLDISNNAERYFQVFKRLWSYTGVHRDAYNLLWQGVPLKIEYEEEEDGYYVPGVGYVKEEQLNFNFDVIPYIFGTAKKDVLKNDEELKDIYANIIHELERSINSKLRKKNKSLKDELHLIKRS